MGIPNEGQHGWRRLIVWQNAVQLRRYIYDTTSKFPKSELRRVSQMQDAARSVKQNIQEGYSRYSLKEYLQGLNIAKGSLGELIGDIEDCFQDGLIDEQDFKILDELSGKTLYLFNRLISALRKKQAENSWVKF